MNRDNQIKTISGLSSLWDSRPVNGSRAGEGSMILYGRRVILASNDSGKHFSSINGE